jgi:hypothetical protein
MVERTDYAALRAHLDAGRPWLDPMTWALVDDAEAEANALTQALDAARVMGERWAADPATNGYGVALLTVLDVYGSQTETP